MSLNVSVLDNGLTIVSDTNVNVETASLGVWLNVGARSEDALINGVSHVLEHMAFKGTTNRSAKDIAETIENVGGYINAYTSREKTAYYVRVLKEHVPIGIDILSDILQNSTFLENEFKREQAVIIQEINQTLDTPDDLVFDYFQETCFPGQSMGRPILGTEETVKSLTPSIVKKYMDDHYGAKQMVLSAAGNIEHENVVSLAKEYFNNLSFDKSKKCEKAKYKGGDFRKDKDLEQVQLVLGFEGVPYLDIQYYSYVILSLILGGGMSSRLFQEIREKKGLVYAISCFHSPSVDTGVFGIYAGTSQDKTNEVIDTIGNEFKKFTDSCIDTELNRAKAQLKASLMMILESTSSRCEQMASNMHNYHRVLSTKEILEKVDKTTKEDVKTVFLNILKTNPTVTILGPISGIYDYENIIKRIK